jgi:hypothetical protein
MMKALLVLLTAFLAIGSYSNLSAYPASNSSKSASVKHGKKHGDFTMLGLGAKSSVLLSNNYFYVVTREKEAKLIRNWKLDDPIRVLKSKHDRRYTLTNLRTGESIKTKIFNW